MDKNRIIKNFSRYAASYDKYADIQKNCAEELLSRIDTNGFKKILEIGCGTGNYTALLQKKFKKAAIKAIDISEKMLEVAKERSKGARTEFIAADAECLDLEEKFDLVTSNACFQWFEDFEDAMQKYSSLLNDFGIILFSIFGSKTFCELNSILKNLSRDVSIEADGFIAKDRLKKALSKNFSDVDIEEVIYKKTFLSLMDLLKSIKYTGTGGQGLGIEKSLTRQDIKNLETAYIKKYGKIIVTYQVFYGRGVK